MMMTAHRAPAVAGLFYPADPEVLGNQVNHYLDEAHPTKLVPRALIVPHAGLQYSGPIAATAYKTLEPIRSQITRVLMLGPSHRVGFDGVAFPLACAFETPLGDIPLDHDAIERLSHLPGVTRSDVAHVEEHSLEVQLPFLQQILGDFTIVPGVIGRAHPEDLVGIIEPFLDDPNTLILISSDLSHYLTYGDARQRDKHTSDAILNLQPALIDYKDACGRTGVNALLLLAQKRGLQAELLDLRNSGDTAGDHSRVVGYGAYLFH